MLMGSTKSLTPCDSNTWSPEPWPFSSIIRPYWKPEQPPPCTNTRSPLPVLCSSARSSLILDAAVVETLIMSKFSSGSLPVYHSVFMPYVALPAARREARAAAASTRWDAILAARPDLAPAIALQKRLVAIVIGLTETIEQGRLPRLSLPPRYVAAKLGRGIPALAGEPIPVPVPV